MKGPRDAVAHLVDKLRRAAAELHRREYLHRDAALGLLFDGLGPGLEQHFLRRRAGRQEVMHFQFDGLLGRSGAHRQAQSQQTT